MKISYLLAALAPIALHGPTLVGAKEAYGTTTTTAAPSYGYATPTTTAIPDDDGYGYEETEAPTTTRRRYSRRTTTVAPDDDGYGYEETEAPTTTRRRYTRPTTTVAPDDDGYGYEETEAPTTTRRHYTRPTTTVAPDDDGYGYDDEEETEAPTTTRRRYSRPTTTVAPEDDGYGYDDEETEAPTTTRRRYSRPTTTLAPDEDVYGYDDDTDAPTTTKRAYSKPTTTKRVTPAPTTTVAPAHVEFLKFWNTQLFCDAQLAFTECLLDVNVVQDFATTARAAHCIKSFTTTLCHTVNDQGYHNGKVSVGAQSCTDDAALAALYTIADIQRVTIGGALTPVNLFLADNPDSFTLVKSAIASQALVTYGSCVTGSLVYFADQSNAQQVFGNAAGTCLNSILKTCSNGDYEDDNPQENNYQSSFALKDLLSKSTVWTDKELHDGHKASPVFLSDGQVAPPPPAVVKSEVELLADLLSSAPGSSSTRFTKISLSPSKNAPNTASLVVYPNYYSALNYHLNPVATIPDSGVPPPVVAAAVLLAAETIHLPTHATGGLQPEHLVDFPGTPIGDLAFHFPAQVWDVSTSSWKPQAYGAGGPGQFPEGTPYDPITPAEGIRDTCKHFYTLSLIAYFAGVDTGDYCFSIDKYSVEFVESGEVQDLRFEQLTANPDQGPCDTPFRPLAFGFLNAIANSAIAVLDDVTATAQDKANANNALIGAQVWWLAVNTEEHACVPGYKVSWDDPSYCPRHLARFRQHTRCCRSFASVQQAKKDKQDKTYKPVTQGHYAKDIPAVCPDHEDIEYTTLVYSESQKGDLTATEPTFVLPHFLGLIDKTIRTFLIFQGVEANLSDDQKAAFYASLDFFHFDPNTYKTLADLHINPTLPQDVPYPQDPYESAYLNQNDYCASAFDTVSINWGRIIPLEPSPNTCYNPSCLLSRYIDCAERPAVDEDAKYKAHKRYIPVYNNQATSYYRSLLNVESSPANWILLSSTGFVAGIVVVAVAQLAMTMRRSTSDATVPYRQIM
ncbi:hypothetical protein DYB38_008278 [Aphanomyces astaci]|uniref:Uncharacterized protein n=1 Tax=Aphanomyces astaci TaxID=112090 RepID=A0A397D7R6_APHAT|nr:hypothetical protein DYB38_008278 [Aphanomyces astaci]